MYSSSSSEYETDENWQYETGYNRNYGNVFGQHPFYPSMGHPLIYYAEVPQPISLKHRSREKCRENPNCFVKAFRWYTEEHVRRNASPPSPDITGFANWLDNKYEQFLQSGQDDANMYHLKLKQTSVLEVDRIPNNSYRESEAPKKYRLKSPWKKKRRTKSNEARDTIKQPTQSFHYILQPKDLSQEASENGHQFSNSTIVKTESVKRIVKSRSCTNVSLNKNEEPIDIITIREEIDSRKKNCQNSPCLNKYIDVKASNEKQQGSLKNIIAPQDFSCQYSEEKPVKINAGTQYDVMNSTTSSSVLNSCCLLDTYCACQKLDRNEAEPYMVSVGGFPDAEKDQKHFNCQCSKRFFLKIDAQTQSIPTTISSCEAFRNVNNCYCILKELSEDISPPKESLSKIINECPCDKQQIVVGNTIVLTKSSSEAVQTSNHSIHLEKETIHEYPLFMKIVCADKLSDEHVK